MRCLNEDIARDANGEDNCTGRFWEGRFKSYALLDNAALLSCMAYVDLNPIRAGLVETLEESDFTSIQERKFTFARSTHREELSAAVNDDQSTSLVPFIGNEYKNKISNGIYFSQEDYFYLVEWTGRVIREDKKGFIPPTVAPILAELNLDPDIWLANTRYFLKPYKRYDVTLIKRAA